MDHNIVAGLKSVAISFLVGMFFAACGENSNSISPSDTKDSSSSCFEKNSYSSVSQSPSSSSGQGLLSAESNGSVVKSSSSLTVDVVDPSTVVMGKITDSRDGQTYKTVRIGEQIWMAENLNYETADSDCYRDSVEYCTKYGRLYSWSAARTACMNGWHLPTLADFETMLNTVGGQTTAGKMLKSTSGWTRSGNDNMDVYSFAALPAGLYFYGDYKYESSHANFWSSTEFDRYYAYSMWLSHNDDRAILASNDDKYNKYSVRCMKD